MKAVFLISIIMVLCNSLVYAQEPEKEKRIYPINEFVFSLNRTTVADGNTKDRFGFGAGLYHAFFDKKRCNLITGLEYNRNSQLKKQINTYDAWGSKNYNVTYSINNFGIPVCFRVNIGQKVRFFVEAGAFFDFIILGREKGTNETVIYNPIDSTRQQYDGPINNKASYNVPNFGIQGGVGLRIPVQKHEILLKGDYKWGVRNLNDHPEYIYSRYWRLSIGFKLIS